MIPFYGLIGSDLVKDLESLVYHYDKGTCKDANDIQYIQTMEKAMNNVWLNLIENVKLGDLKLFLRTRHQSVNMLLHEMFQFLSVRHSDNLVTAIIATGSAANAAFHNQHDLLEAIPDIVDAAFSHAYDEEKLMNESERTITPLFFDKKTWKGLDLNNILEKELHLSYNLFVCLGPLKLGERVIMIEEAILDSKDALGAIEYDSPSSSPPSTKSINPNTTAQSTTTNSQDAYTTMK